MQNKKPLRYNTESAVQCDVQKHFSGRLPAEWKALVYFACFPQILEDTDVLGFEDMKPIVDAFHRCLDADPDLALEVIAYARKRCDNYDPMRCDTQAGLVRAVLLRSWRATVVSENGRWRRLTPQEAHQHLYGDEDPNSKRLKTMEVSRLQDAEIADWLTREYGLTVTTESVHTERRALSEAAKDENPS